MQKKLVHDLHAIHQQMVHEKKTRLYDFFEGENVMQQQEIFRKKKEYLTEQIKKQQKLKWNTPNLNIPLDKVKKQETTDFVMQEVIQDLRKDLAAKRAERQKVQDQNSQILFALDCQRENVKM